MPVSFRIAVPLVCCLCLLSLSSAARAQTSYPMIMKTTPAAAQVGTSAELEIESRYSMFGAYKVLVTGTGVTGEVITPMELDKEGKEPSLTKIKVRFDVAPDAQPGVRDFRIGTPTGATTLGQLVIVRDPVVTEQDKNNTPDEAQEVTLPTTLCGTIERAEDVDYFKFHLDEPTTVNLHCRAMRLQDKIHDLQQHVDPIITIKTIQGSTVAAADNTYAADPLLSPSLPAGDYLLEVRDVRFQGNRYWSYVIEFSDRPFVAHVHPLAARPGESTQLELVGLGLPSTPSAEWTVPSDLAPGQYEIPLPMGDSATNPVGVVISDVATATEPLEENNTTETASPLAIPGGVSGRIETEADIDYYRFEAKKGEKLTFEVVARRQSSQLDPILAIVDANGRRLTENDDLRLWGKRTYQDSLIENWTVPADGVFFVEVRDVHLRGGAGFVYFLKATRAEPTFELHLDSDKVIVTPGTAGVLFARVVRKNGFDGEVQLHVDGLPAHVTAECGRILPGKPNDGCIIFRTEADAPLDLANIRVWGTAVHPMGEEPDLELSIPAQPMQETYMPGGGRNHWPVEMCTVAIARPLDIHKISLSTNEVTLKPGESQKIEVEIVRAEGFDKNVTLDLLYQHLSSVFANTLPPGVTIDGKQSKTLLSAKETKGYITLKASADAAPVERQQCSLMANVSINFVMKATYSSDPLLVTVAPKE